MFGDICVKKWDPMFRDLFWKSEKSDPLEQHIMYKYVSRARQN